MNNQEKYKLQMFSELAQLCKGMSSDKRLMILNLLIQAPKTVETIAKETGMSIANTSRHLQVLKKSHLVKSIKDRNYIIYSLINYKIVNLVEDLIEIGEDEIISYKNAQNAANSEAGVKVISLSEAKEIASKSFILDVRPEDEYIRGHIEGAVNIPFDKIDNELSQLPKDKPIIVYCRGKLCPITNQITQKLNNQGFEAYSLNNIYQEW